MGTLGWKLFGLAGLIALVVACETPGRRSTYLPPGFDAHADAVTDAGDTAGPDGSDDGGGAADDGSVTADDGSVTADDGATGSDDGSALADDGGATGDDGSTVTDDGASTADDGGGAADDGGAGGDDEGVSGDDGGGAEIGPNEIDTSPVDTTAQIVAAREATEGATDLPIAGAWVTYKVPQIETYPAGFTIQADPEGPALFVGVDPATLSPEPAVGDQVSLIVTEMGNQNGLKQANAISGFTVLGDFLPVGIWTQDLSKAGDIVSGLDGYESEPIRLTGLITGDFGYAGAGHVSASLDTELVAGSADLKLRLPEALQTALELRFGCVVTLEGTPMWRYFDQAQPSAWTEADITVESCPDLTVLSAVSLSPTTVQITFDMPVDPSSVLASGSQFHLDGGLTAVAAAVDGDTVLVTTTSQSSGQLYSVQVDPTVESVSGLPVDSSFDAATFYGYDTPAVLWVNELHANVSGGCDRVELRVVNGGSIGGFVLKERTSVVLQFDDLPVQTNDIIVVHFDALDATNCNPWGAESELYAADELPHVFYPSHTDDAWDVWTSDSGITNTDNVITVQDAAGQIVDAVLVAHSVADPYAATAASASENQAAKVAAAGEWTMVGGGVPAGGFVDADFYLNAVEGLQASTSADGASIQRSSDVDTDTKQGWTHVESSTFGALNAGQLPF